MVGPSPTRTEGDHEQLRQALLGAATIWGGPQLLMSTPRAPKRFPSSEWIKGLAGQWVRRPRLELGTRGLRVRCSAS
jgi:hypothetical protein